MNEDIPCRVSADIRAHHAGRDYVTDKIRDYAREELIGLLLEGKQVGRFTFADILESELDSGRIDFEALAQHLIDSSAKEQWLRGFAERLLESHPDLVEDRAAELAQED